MTKRSNSEGGHAKNVANFEDMKERCKTYGPAYNPSRPELQLSGLEQKHQDAQMVLRLVADWEVKAQDAANQCAKAFKELRPKVTRVINSMIACGLSDKSITDARALQRLIQGTRANKKKNGEDKPVTEAPPESTADDAAPTEDHTAATEGQAAATEETPATRTVSASRQSQDMLVEHLSKLNLLLQREPAYNPNEPELQLSGLMAHEQYLRGLITTAAAATAELEAARFKRFEVLYDPVTGLVTIAQQVKSYVKAVFGSTSQQYKQLAKLIFRKIGK